MFKIRYLVHVLLLNKNCYKSRADLKTKSSSQEERDGYSRSSRKNVGLLQQENFESSDTRNKKVFFSHGLTPEKFAAFR